MSHKDNGAPFRIPLSVRSGHLSVSDAEVCHLVGDVGVWFLVQAGTSRPPRGVSSWWSCLKGRNWFGPRGCSLWSPPGAERVVCARWCPTLPHPGGCSTIGAVRLSFRVRDGAGRFPVAVTTETTTWAVRQCSCDSVIRLPADTRTRTRMLCVWLVDWVGCGPYSGRFALTVSLTPGLPTHARCVVCVWGCCCLCWPISTSQL